eukprot:88656-Pyramimonas_sp.AAC.1
MMRKGCFSTPSLATCAPRAPLQVLPCAARALPGTTGTVGPAIFGEGPASSRKCLESFCRVASAVKP